MMALGGHVIFYTTTTTTLGMLQNRLSNVFLLLVGLLVIAARVHGLTGSYAASAGSLHVENVTTSVPAPGGRTPCNSCDVRPFYVGAGRNDPAKGTQVGTVTVCNDNVHLWIALTIYPSYAWSELHVAAASQNGEIDHVFGHYPFKAACPANAVCRNAYLILPLANMSVTAGNLVFYAVHIATSSASAVQGTGLLIGAPNQCFNFNEVFNTGRWGAYCAYVVRACGTKVPPPPPPCVDPYEPPCLAYRTITQGGWGTTAHGHNPGWYRDTHWPLLLQQGLPQIGCAATGRVLTFAASSDVVVFLSATRGTPALLDVTAGVSTPNSIMAAQLLAATLNVAFDEADPDDFGRCPDLLRDLCFGSGTPCANQTVASVLSAANQLIGGCPASMPFAGMSLSAMNGCLTAINENFDGSVPVGDLVSCAH